MLPPRPLLEVWGGLSYPNLFSAGWGWSLGRLLSFAPCIRLYPLSGCTSLRLWVLGGFLVLSFVLPWPWVCLQVHLTGSVPCLQIAFLGLEPSPSGVASVSAGRFSWHPGAAGALAVPSLRLRVSESSSLSAWSFPFRGL